MKYLCVYVLWPSSVRLATGPGIEWDSTITIVMSVPTLAPICNVCLGLWVLYLPWRVCELVAVSSCG